jgi:hypothetical protein
LYVVKSNDSYLFYKEAIDIHTGKKIFEESKSTDNEEYQALVINGFYVRSIWYELSRNIQLVCYITNDKDDNIKRYIDGDRSTDFCIFYEMTDVYLDKTYCRIKRILYCFLLVFTLLKRKKEDRIFALNNEKGLTNILYAFENIIVFCLFFWKKQKQKTILIELYINDILDMIKSHIRRPYDTGSYDSKYKSILKYVNKTCFPVTSRIKYITSKLRRTGGTQKRKVNRQTLRK